MKLIRNLFARSDRARARNALQDICDERLAARRRLEEANRKADRAMREAMELEAEAFREEFFGNRNLVRSAFIGGDL